MSERFEYPLGAEQITAFERDGVIHLPGVLDEEFVERGREACVQVPAVETVEGSTADEYFMKLRCWEKNETFKQICTASVMPGIAAQLVRSKKMNVLYDQMFSIAPGSGDRTPWHHDLPYWPVRGSQVVTLWVAFDHVTQENGALKFIRGSHLWDVRYQAFSTGEDNEDGFVPFESGVTDGVQPIPDFDVQRTEHDIVSFDLVPGDALAFHGLSVHASHPNTTANMQRRGYAMRYTGDDVRYYAGPVWNVYIVNPTLTTGDLLDSDQYPVVFESRLT